MFTVNYDLLIETALEKLGVAYFDGFVGALHARFRTDLVEATSADSEGWLPSFLMRLWKLHGSVNWAWDTPGRADVVRLGSAVATGEVAAIYPSDTKYDESRRVPFVVLQDRFRRALYTAESLVLVTGYSWRDEHINELLIEGGAGKTSAVASILQGFVKGGWRNANIVVIDPHGEYTRALGPNSSTRSVLAKGNEQLRVPFWALPCEDILRVFTGGTGGATTAKRFAELTRIQRQRFVEEASWLQLDPAAVTADTPVPFDINIVWHTLDYENNETRHKKSDPATVAVKDEGDAAALRSAHFEPYNPGSTTPDKAPTYGNYGSTPEVLRLGLLDNRLQFFLQPVPDPNGDVDPLVAAMTDWLGGERPISILDFSGVPDQAAELAIGVVLNLLFEVAVRSEPDGPGIGRPNPVLVVLEEAHRYLGDMAAPIAGAAANRIAREGRKYGSG